jgi:hypothetical protein
MFPTKKPELRGAASSTKDPKIARADLGHGLKLTAHVWGTGATRSREA